MAENRTEATTSALAPVGDPSAAPLNPSELFRGKTFVVVGGTGFLGKVWVSMFLHLYPDLGKMVLLVRAKEGQTAEERFWAQIAPSRVFDPIREAHPGAAYEQFLKDKVHVVGGDVIHKNLGFSDELVAELKGNTAAVVNVAGVVDFNPPLDEALDVNAFGLQNLIELARELGAPIQHTSTCYVAGYRTGEIAEVDPREVPFPRAAGAPRARLIAPPKEFPMGGDLDRLHWDPQNEIAESMDVIEHVRHRCEDAFRQSAFLDQAKKRLESRGEPCRGTALEEELAAVKRRYTRDRLIEAGMERALYWGWPNIYTYTKSIGEQVLAASGVPFTIVRPAVVESSTHYPFQSWNEGINTSAPFIYMALKGQVQFPSDKDVSLDIIPVDMVVSGMLAALAELIEGTHQAVYQLGCGDVNGCKMTRYMELIGLYKRKKLQDGGDEGNMVVNAIIARCEPVCFSKKDYFAHGPHKIASTARGFANLLDRAGVGPLRSLFAPAARAIVKASAGEEKLAEIMDLFLPFVAECAWIFSCANTRAAMARMPEEERKKYYWDPEGIDWRQWMYDVHLPGIEEWAKPLIDEKARKEIKPHRRYDNLIDLIDEMADRHEHAVALRELGDDGFSRITYSEWRIASGTVGARLQQAGVKKGDRVVLSGDNRPAWAIAYFGILLAGAIAVPVDPKLAGPQLLNIVSSSGAQVALWGKEVDDEGGEHVRLEMPSLKVLDLDETTAPDRRLEAPHHRPEGADLASIIYTSGTTGSPKGVMLTHENFTSMLAALTPLFPLRPGNGVLSVLPLHHTFEFSCGLLLPMSRGATVAYIGEITAERLGEGFDKARIHAMVGVPALWQMLERKITQRAKEGGALQEKAFDISLELNRMLGKNLGLDVGKLFFGKVHDTLGGQVKYLISGGGALPQDTAKLFAGLGLPLSEGYGLTEASPVLTVAKATPRTRAGHVGKPIPGVEIKILDADEGGVGEVVARGPNVMSGYFGNDDATKQVIDEDGWLHTGDLGKLDKRGQLVLSGRSKDVIVSTSGENVYPDDVEELLSNISGIEELSIVGLLDARGNEVVACLAVPTHDDDGVRAEEHDKALENLRDKIRELPRVCQPTVVHLYDADLPKTATRKVKRSEVKIILERLQTASAPMSMEMARSADSNLLLVRQAVAAISGGEADAINTSMSLAGDLGFDSLMSMELTVALEKQIGRSLDGDRMARVETVGDVVRLVGTSRRARAIAKIEKAEAEAIDVPPAVAKFGKSLLTGAQMGFYGKMMKPKVHGRAFIPHNRNTIVVSNHSSHLDMGFVKYALGTYGEDLVSLAAQDYFFKGKLRQTYFEHFSNLHAFDRKGSLRQSLKKAAEPLKQGKTVLLFPEGTRSTDGQIHEFKSTVGHIALNAGVDILPVYLGGTYESWPKGRRVPTRRDISAHIGLPLRVDDLRRLTEGMKTNKACRAIAALAREAVVALQRGGILDLSEHESVESALGQKTEHPLVVLFRDLETKFVAGKVKKPVLYYFSLGAEAEAKWTCRIEPDKCWIGPGKPEGSADCVLKTSADMFTKIVREAYMPTPVEVMSGQIKSNDVSLLATFQEAFNLA